MLPPASRPRASSCARPYERGRPDRRRSPEPFSARLSHAPITIRGGAARPLLWPPCRNPDWVRRPGASPPMRMPASWCGSHRIPRIQGCGRDLRARHASSPRIVDRPCAYEGPAPPDFDWSIGAGPEPRFPGETRSGDPTMRSKLDKKSPIQESRDGRSSRDSGLLRRCAPRNDGGGGLVRDYIRLNHQPVIASAAKQSRVT